MAVLGPVSISYSLSAQLILWASYARRIAQLSDLATPREAITRWAARRQGGGRTASTVGKVRRRDCDPLLRRSLGGWSRRWQVRAAYLCPSPPDRSRRRLPGAEA